MEITVWCCNDQLPQWQSASSKLSSSNSQRSIYIQVEEEVTRSSGGDPRQRTAHPADLFNYTRSRDGARYSIEVCGNWVDLTPDTHQKHIGCHYVLGGKDPGMDLSIC